METCLSSNEDDGLRIYDINNEIYFNGSVTQKSMSLLIEKLLNLESRLLKKSRKLKRKLKEDIDKDDDFEEIEMNIEPKPIKLFITTNGGLIYQVFSAIDTIKNLKIPVHTICKGFCASAGTLLSLAGKKRFITENSYMLIHELRSGSWGKYTHLVESVDNSKKLMDHIKNYYLVNTKMSMEELDEQLKKDVIWDANKCLEKGLVDEIINN